MPEVHAKLSASGAKKWLNCPGSVRLEATMPESSSSYAAEGTTAHSLGEAKIRLATKCLTRVQYHKQKADLEIDAEMEEYTNAYRDFVIERLNAAKANTPDAILAVEQRLDFSEWVPGGFGTGDCIIISDKGVEIIDLKYGKGVQVEAEENSQLMLYALGAIAEYGYLYDLESVTMTIFQPRIDNISSYTMAVDELEAWGEEVKSKAILADSDEGECYAGSHCAEGFCKARPFCRIYAESCSKAAAFDFRKPAELNTDEIAEVLELSERLTKWSALVKDYALDQALHHNVRYPGYKLVEGRSNRAFTTEEKEIAGIITNAGFIDDEVWPRKLKGLEDLEKLIGKKQFGELLNGYIFKPEGKPTLVPAEDRRPELNTAESAAEDFKKYIEN